MRHALIFLWILIFAGAACFGPGNGSGDGGPDADGAVETDDGNGGGDDGAASDDGGFDAGDAGFDAGPDGGGDTGGDNGPVHPCGETTFRYRPQGAVASVLVSGTFNGWAASEAAGAYAMSDPDQDGEWTATRVIEPGTHQYKFIVDGNWIPDPDNPHQVDDGYGGKNSVLVIQCGAKLRVVSFQNDASSLDAALILEPEELALDPASVRASLNFNALSGPAVSVSGDTITVRVTGLSRGIFDLRVSARATDGSVAPEVLLKFHLGISTDWRDAVLYFAMTDRFFDGNGANNAPVAGVDSRVNFSGGDFEGIRQKIADGYFGRLGVNAIWISWPVDNLDGYEDGGRADEHHCGMNPATMRTAPMKYTAYHGYWPVHLDRVEERFGTEEELRALVVAAHEKGIRVLLDLTANHVHTASPLYQQHPEYFNYAGHGSDHICQNVGWDNDPERCWFTSYLADLDYTQPGAVQAMTDMAIDWILRTGADGFRVDAVKHVNRVFLTALRARLREEIELTGIPFYLVGETFTGDAGLIKSFIGDTLIHGQFDFPTNMQILRGFATQEDSLMNIDSAVRSAKGVYGAAAIMSNFIGNHDMARFASLANGDTGCGVWDITSDIAKGWLSPPPDAGEQGHKRLRLAFVYLMGLPGIPLIYYGDEFGLSGAGDPDNRRSMRFGDDLSDSLEKPTLAFVQKLGTVRAAHPALRTGSWPPALAAGADYLAFARQGSDETVFVAINRGASTRAFDLDVSGLGIANGQMFEDALSQPPLSATVSAGRLAFSLAATTAAILVPKAP
jgi:glycosidase